MKLHLRTVNVHQNILSLFVLFIGVIRRTGTWQINDVTCSMSSVDQTWHTKIVYLLTYSLGQSPSWYSKRNSACQDIPHIL